MQIRIRRENFAADDYELQIRDAALAFAGANDSFSLPCSAVRDFYVTQDRRDKTFFTMLSGDRMYEGQILEPAELEPFMAALKAMMGGVMSIEVCRQ